MDDTGRLKRPLRAEAARHVYARGEAPTDESARGELWRITEVDRAHLTMLAEAGIAPDAAAVLLEEIERARCENFAEVLARPAPRGLFIAWEDVLVGRVGMRVAGMLQTGRSRNDLNATLALIAAREVWIGHGDALEELVGVLRDAAERWADVTMPAYTNGAPAAVTTYGHWLAAVGLALERDLAAWAWLGRGGPGTCPLGAGATAGTTLPIDAERTAHLLGFERPLVNSIDAVASRDVLTRLAAVAVSVTATLARVAGVLLQWTSPDIGFLRLPDDLSGASSSLPQKRNAFLLEHVAGAHGAALGAYVGAMSATARAPFGNSIISGTEAMNTLPAGFAAMLKAIELTAMVLDGANVDRGRMAAAAAAHFTTASAVAEHLMQESGLSFREAHREVGCLVTDLEENGQSFAGLALTDPAAALAANASRGGPNAATIALCIEALEKGIEQWRDEARTARRRWAAATAELDDAARTVRISKRAEGAR
jgi:argininosuccinate lyase